MAISSSFFYEYVRKNEPSRLQVTLWLRRPADSPAMKGMVDEVTYGGSVKAFAFLLNNHYNVAINKVSDMIFEISQGKLKLSYGMICGLSK